MKTAREMFVELGYLKFQSNDREIIYMNIDSHKIIFAENSYTARCQMNIPLHLAIHKQLEELGWLG